MAPNSFEMLRNPLILHRVEIGAWSMLKRRKVEHGRNWVPEYGSVGVGPLAKG